MLRQVPARATEQHESRSQVSARKFMRHVLRACKELREDAETARGGAAYVRHYVDREYRVFQRDYRDFAQRFTDVLERIDLREVCGITFLRFYMAQHELRLDKSQAQNMLQRMLDVDHRHMDVAQIHRAHTLVPSNRAANTDDDEGVLLVKLSGRVAKDLDSLAALLRDCVRLDDKIDKYRAGFLNSYGFFCRHAAGCDYSQRFVTFVQAYNTSAKMARPDDSGYLLSLVVAGGYLTDSGDRHLRQLAERSRQHARDIATYCINYVAQGQALQLEEVVTLDRVILAIRFGTNISRQARELGIFCAGVATVIARYLTQR